MTPAAQAPNVVRLRPAAEQEAEARQAEVVDFLEQALLQAKAGRFSSAMLVCEFTREPGCSVDFTTPRSKAHLIGHLEIAKADVLASMLPAPEDR